MSEDTNYLLAYPGIPRQETDSSSPAERFNKGSPRIEDVGKRVYMMEDRTEARAGQRVGALDGV